MKSLPFEVTICHNFGDKTLGRRILSRLAMWMLSLTLLTLVPTRPVAIHPIKRSQCNIVTMNATRLSRPTDGAGTSSLTF